MDALRIGYSGGDGRVEGFNEAREVCCVCGGAVDDGVAAGFDASEIG